MRCGELPSTPEKPPGRDGRARLDRQVGGLVAREAGWQHVATYADQSLAGDRPGLSRLFAEAPGRFDVVVVDGSGRLSPDRRELGVIVDQLRWAGVGVVVLRPSGARRLAKVVANLALADLVGGSLTP